MAKRVMSFVVGLIALVGLAGAPGAFGATYYAAPSGQSGCSQQSSAPQGGLNNGARCLGAGDTLIVKSGTYNETLDLNVLPNGSSSAPTTIRAEVMRGAILKAGGGAFVRVGGSANKQWLTVDGLVLDGGNAGASSGHIDVNAQGGSGNLLFVNMEIRNLKGDNYSPEGGNFATSAAIFASWFSTNTIFRNMYIHDIGTNQPPGSSCNECYTYVAYISGAGFTLENSQAINASGFAIHGYTSGAGGASNNIIRNNYFQNTGAGLLMCQSNNQIYNNVLNKVGVAGGGNNWFGIRINWYCSGQASSGNLIAHNTIVGSKGTCIELGRTTNGTVRNNLCYQNARDVVDTMSSGGMTIDHNLLGTDPKFVNAGTGDFHVQSGSPAVNAATTIGAVTTDLEGTTRPQDSTYDIGAYELKSAATLPTVTFSADPPSLSAGASATLTWGSTNTTTCTGTNFSTGGATSGAVRVRPTATTTYRVACTGPGGSAGATTQVTLTGEAAMQGTFWVDTMQGDDLRTCTQATTQTTPKKTLASVLPCILGGSTITLRAGTYPERLDSTTMTIPGGADWAHKTLITRYRDEVVTLKPGSGTTPVVRLQDAANRFLELAGLTLDVSGVTGANAVLIQGPAAAVRVRETTVTGAPATRAAVYIFNSADDEVLQNTVTGNGATAIYVDGTSSGTRIERNTITAFGPAAGIMIDQQATGVIVNANYVHDPGAGSPAMGIVLKNTASVLVSNNILANLPIGIQVTWGSAGVNTEAKLYNNTLSNTATAGIDLDAHVTKVDIMNNILAGPTTGIQAATTSVTFGANLCTVAGTGCALVADPHFTNAAGEDYTLAATSPAVEAGVTLAEVPRDYVGVARPQPPGGAYDLGAYEVVSTPITPPTPIPPLPENAAFFNACYCWNTPTPKKD